MSSRRKLKLLKKAQAAVPEVPAPPPQQTVEEIQQGTNRAVNKRLQLFESSALNLDHLIHAFTPPDPAGPPNKHVLLHTEGVDFTAITLLRERTKRMLKCLDDFELISQWVTDHPSQPLPSPWPPPKPEKKSKKAAAEPAPEPAPA